MRICLFLAACAVMCGASPSRLTAQTYRAGSARQLELPKYWQPVAQPALETELRQAPLLDVQNLGTAAHTVDVCGTSLVYDAASRSYDVLVWYRKQYRQSTRAYVIDLDSGDVTKQEFTEEEDRARVEMAFTWFGTTGLDGKLYGAITDQKTWDQGGIMRIYRYDPSTNKIGLYKRIDGHGGERNPTVLSPDGWIYGAGTWLGKENKLRRASAYGFDPETGEVRNFGAIGPVIEGTAYGYSIGACDTHIYVACGKIPWHLVAVDTKSGKETVLLEAPEGSYGITVNGNQNLGGAVACVQPTSDPASKQYYWLYHGKAIRKKTSGFGIDDSCPWSARLQALAPVRANPTPPQLHEGQLYPDADGRAVLWWRSAFRRSQNLPWIRVDLKGVEKHPLKLHRVHALADGRIFGTGHGAKGRFLVEPETRQITELANGGGSPYALTNFGSRLYFSGYAGGSIFEFDPDQPWNLDQGGPPGTELIESSNRSVSSRNANPRRVNEDRDAIFKLTRVKKMLSGTTAGDGRIYFGGKGQRDYVGGGLSWYDPETGKAGGIWKPFAGQDIGWVTTALRGRLVVIGASGGKVYQYDTSLQKLRTDRTITPVPGADKSGPLLEVATGRLLGMTHDGPDRSRSVIYAVDALSGEVLFTKRVPWGPPRYPSRAST